MGFREVSVVEVREVLRAWLEGHGLRQAAERAGVDRKTPRRYVEAAQAAGLTRDEDADAVTDELVGVVVEAVRPRRSRGLAVDRSMEILDCPRKQPQVDDRAVVGRNEVHDLAHGQAAGVSVL